MDTDYILYELEGNLRQLYYCYPSKKGKLWMIVELIDYIKKNHEKNTTLCLREIDYVLTNYTDYLEKNFRIDNTSLVFDNLERLESSL
jgi:hypothetical protein